MHTSNVFLVNFDLIFDELKLFIPSKPSVKYNFMNLLFEVSNAYLLIVVNVAFNLDASISDSFLSVVVSFFSFFDSSSFFFLSASIFFNFV